ELGGAQKHVLTLLSHLDSSRYEKHLVSSDGLLAQDAKRLTDVRVLLLSSLTRLPNPFLDLVAFWVLVWYMKKYQIQLVHTHSSKAGILGRWAAKMAGVPVILHTVHGWAFHDYLKSFFNDFCIFLEKLTATITTKIIVVSQHDRQKGLRCGIGRQDQYVVIRNDVGLDATPRTARQKEDIKHAVGVGEERVVTMIACFKPQKNPLDFIKAAEMVKAVCPDTKFLLVGDGALRASVGKEIHRRHLDADVLMLSWRRDIGDLLAISDVVVLTSLWEGQPLVFLEAMSFARPIVAYDICGNNEVVKDGFSGFLVPPGDIRQLSEKIRLFLVNPELRDRMGKLGMHLLSGELVRTSSMVTLIDSLYKELMARLRC
ncbi:MAG: glycosyltransferase family 4 protein, partial [Candidatus Omnitrophota bacterium]